MPVIRQDKYLIIGVVKNGKIELDKYYTSDELAKYCIERTKK